MRNHKKILDGLSYREYLRFVTHLPFVDNYPFKEGQTVLELSNNNLFLSSALPANKKDTLNITSLNFAAHFRELEASLEDRTKQNIYSTVFCFLYTDFIHYDSRLLIDYLYYVLRPGGILFLTHPTNKTSTIASYKQVIKSGKFPFLSEEVNVHDQSFDRIKATLTETPFTDIKIEDHVDKVILPDLYFFKRYLYETAYLYKKVTSTETSDKIIDMQVDFFDEYCKKHFNGEYIFEYTLRTIRAIK